MDKIGKPMDLSEVGDITLRQKIGEGAFGLVRIGHQTSSGLDLAVKLELASVPKPLLLKESSILNSLQSSPGVPHLYTHGTVNGYNFLAMELLGNSLNHKLKTCGGRLSPPTVLRCAGQMFETLESVHSAGFVHRDIKPQNFLVGLRTQKGKVFLIDFGLAKRCASAGFFRPQMRDPGQFTGTLPFVSINTHLGIRASRRDDLESLSYVLIFLLRGSLPWCRSSSADFNEREVRSSKVDISPSELCKGLPIEIEMLVRYAKGLKFEEIPNFLVIKEAFKAAELRLGPEKLMDWEDRKLGHGRSKSNKSPRKSKDKPLNLALSLSDLPEIIPSETSVTKLKEPGSKAKRKPAVLQKEKTVQKMFQGFAMKKDVILNKLKTHSEPASPAVIVQTQTEERACVIG